MLVIAEAKLRNCTLTRWEEDLKVIRQGAEPSDCRGITSSRDDAVTWLFETLENSFPEKKHEHLLARQLQAFWRRVPTGDNLSRATHRQKKNPNGKNLSYRDGNDKFPVHNRFASSRQLALVD